MYDLVWILTYKDWYFGGKKDAFPEKKPYSIMYGEE